MINFSRPFIYTTAPSISFFQDIKSGLEDITEDKLQEIQENISWFADALTGVKLEFTGGDTGVFGLIIPGNEACRKAARKMNDSGFDIRPILSPTVPEGTERLRICIHATHSKEQLKQLIDELNSI